MEFTERMKCLQAKVKVHIDWMVGKLRALVLVLLKEWRLIDWVEPLYIVWDNQGYYVGAGPFGLAPYDIGSITIPHLNFQLSHMPTITSIMKLFYRLGELVNLENRIEYDLQRPKVNEKRYLKQKAYLHKYLLIERKQKLVTHLCTMARLKGHTILYLLHGEDCFVLNTTRHIFYKPRVNPGLSPEDVLFQLHHLQDVERLFRLERRIKEVDRLYWKLPHEQG